MRMLRTCLDNEKGVTLIEMLISLFIFLMISSILYSFFLISISIYKSVTLQSQMRNQGDALFSQVITELKDAVYVEQVPRKDNEIIYIKQTNWYSDPKSGNQHKYIERFTMKFDSKEGTITVESVSEPDKGSKVFKMTDAFKITEGKFIADNNNKSLSISITYQRSDASQRPAGQRPVLEIQSKIPLFRIE